MPTGPDQKIYGESGALPPAPPLWHEIIRRMPGYGDDQDAAGAVYETSFWEIPEIGEAMCLISITADDAIPEMLKGVYASTSITPERYQAEPDVLIRAVRNSILKQFAVHDTGERPVTMELINVRDGYEYPYDLYTAMTVRPAFFKQISDGRKFIFLSLHPVRLSRIITDYESGNIAEILD